MPQCTLMPLNMSEHGWVLLNVPEYSWKCLNKLLWLCNGSLCLCFIILNIWQSFEYASGSKYARVLNMTQFWICSNYAWFWISFLNNHEHLKISEYYRTNMLPNMICHHLFVTLLHCQIRKINYLLTVKRKSNVQDTISKNNHSTYRDTFVKSSTKCDK